MQNGLYDLGIVTLDAANTTRFASNVTGATWTLANTTTVDTMAHQVTILNDSVTDHSAKTATLTGTDANDNALTETVNLPVGSATVTSAKYFKTLTTVVPSATIGADTMDIGIAATARTPWVKLDLRQTPINVGVGVEITGTVNYDMLCTFDHTPDGNSIALAHAAPATFTALTGQTASMYSLIGSPVNAVCIDINSHTSGTVNFHLRQHGAI